MILSAKFQSTLSVRRATGCLHDIPAPVQISIHALREESDRVQQHRVRYRLISIHALREESDQFVGRVLHSEQFQSTLSVRRATRRSRPTAISSAFQSTLSVRRATGSTAKTVASGMISIHALREESDFKIADKSFTVTEFQSTLSVRRATQDHVRRVFPRPISIHALREESDSLSPARSRRTPYFNPRSP